MILGLLISNLRDKKKRVESRMLLKDEILNCARGDTNFHLWHSYLCVIRALRGALMTGINAL